MDEFLRRGTFNQLGCYLWLRANVPVDQPFHLKDVAGLLYVSETRVSQRLRELRELGAIEYSSCGPRGVRIDRYLFDLTVHEGADGQGRRAFRPYGGWIRFAIKEKTNG